MTVQELIDELNKIEDKSRDIYCYSAGCMDCIYSEPIQQVDFDEVSNTYQVLNYKGG